MTPVILALAALAIQQSVNQDLPEYAPGARLSGELRVSGSDTLNHFMAVSLESFQKFHPDVRVRIEGKAGPFHDAYWEADFIYLMSTWRPSLDEQIERRFGRKAVLVTAFHDVMAVIVHKDNPLGSLTLQQVEAMFSRSRKPILTWGQAGLRKEWVDRPIKLVGRNAASGSYGFFKVKALRTAEFSDSVREMPGSASVEAVVARDPAAIGYVSIGYLTPGTRVLALAGAEGSKPVRPAHEGSYPLAWPMHWAVIPDDRGRLKPVQEEFFRFVFSKQGQALVLKDGYFPLTAAMAKEQMKKLGIDK